MKDRGRDRLRLALAAAAASAVLLTGPALAAGTAGPDPAKDAAERALDVYRGFVPWEDFGFASQEELRDAVVAEGVPVFRLDPSALDGRLHRLGDAIRDVRLVEFVIASGDRAVTRLTLRRTEDGYERVGFGGDGEHLRRGLSLLPAPEGAGLVLLGPAEFLYWSGEEAEYLVNINGFALLQASNPSGCTPPRRRCQGCGSTPAASSVCPTSPDSLPRPPGPWQPPAPSSSDGWSTASGRSPVDRPQVGRGP